MWTNWLRIIFNKPYMPPMKPIPYGATQQQREKMFVDYVDEVIDLNPWHVPNKNTIDLYHSLGGKRWKT